MRKCGRESRTAVCSSTGILTRPKAMDPFHNARAIIRGACKWKAGSWRLGRLTSGAQLALGLEPVVEVLTVGSTALQVALIRGLGDLVVARVVLRPFAVARRGAGHVRGRLRGFGSLQDP